MRSMLNAPIVFDHAHNGYYYEEKTWRLSAGCATAEELLALGLAQNLRHRRIYQQPVRKSS
jgi:hypothetical protein